MKNRDAELLGKLAAHLRRIALANGPIDVRHALTLVAGGMEMFAASVRARRPGAAATAGGPTEAPPPVCDELGIYSRRCDASSRFYGVSMWGGRWYAAVNRKRVSFRLGPFDGEIDAAIAVNERLKNAAGVAELKRLRAKEAKDKGIAHAG